jgi:hypothetical protein
VDVAAAPSRAVGLGSPCVATGVPLTGGVGLTGPGATGVAWDTGTGADHGRCDRLTHYRGNRGRSGSGIVGVDGGRGVGVVGCTGRVAPHRGVPVGGRGLVGRGGRGLRERAHAVQHLLEHVAQVGELKGDAGELLVDCRASLLHSVQQVQGSDAVGVGFVHPLHVIIDSAGHDRYVHFFTILCHLHNFQC